MRTEKIRDRVVFVLAAALLLWPAVSFVQVLNGRPFVSQDLLGRHAVSGAKADLFPAVAILRLRPVGYYKVAVVRADSHEEQTVFVPQDSAVVSNVGADQLSMVEFGRETITLELAPDFVITNQRDAFFLWLLVVIADGVPALIVMLLVGELLKPKEAKNTPLGAHD